MILAGDIGGTKTLLGVFDVRPARPRAVYTRAFSTTDFPGLTAMLAVFGQDEDAAGLPLSSACFGVAGPVLGDVAELTNVPFTIDAVAVSHQLDVPRVRLLNDLQAMASAVPVLEGDELHVLQAGEAIRGGNVALIAAGTGLGQALLHNVDGRLVPAASEGGHADWAARTDRDITLLRSLLRRYGRAEVEHVIAGRGLLNIFEVTHMAPCSASIDPDAPDAPAAITGAALRRRCPMCVESLEIFVDAYGAEAGNLALRVMATGGVFIGGGIAPKILPALTDGRFMRAFLEKGPMRDLLAEVPVKVILNADAGLLGAAAYAATL
ncbi:MAG: glucokinase [Vicinamibacterales bacterium]